MIFYMLPDSIRWKFVSAVLANVDIDDPEIEFASPDFEDIAREKVHQRIPKHLERVVSASVQLRYAFNWVLSQDGHHYWLGVYYMVSSIESSMISLAQDILLKSHFVSEDK